jgi:GNAT superfamily N-acetyltransferase
VKLVPEVRAVGPTDAVALAAFFDAAGSTCFCRYWHFTGDKNGWLERSAARPEESRAELETAVREARPDGTGLVASVGGVVVGWLKLSPRGAVPKLRNLPVYRTLDLGPDDGVLAIGCMLVHPDHREQGVARSLITGAIAEAKRQGARFIEAYPRRSPTRLYDEAAFLGPEALYRELGFEITVDQPPYPVLRRILSPLT